MFVDSLTIWLIGVVSILMATALIGLVTRAAPGEPIRPTSLSDEDRLLLQSWALEARKQERAGHKKARRRQTQPEDGEREFD